MENKGKRRIGAGALLTAGAFLGREFFVWLWGKTLDFVSGLFGGELPRMSIPTPFPWSDAIGLALALIGLWFLWTSFRRNPKDQLTIIPIPTPPMIAEGGDKASFVATVADPPPFNPKKIYVLNIRIDAQKLFNDFVLSFDVSGFNVSGRAIWIDSISGTISFVSRKSEDTSISELPEAIVSNKSERYKDVAHLSPFNVTIEQRFPRELVENAKNQIDAGERFELDLRKFNILARDFADKSVALPIDYGILIGRTEDIIMTGRSFYAHVVDAVRISDRAGPP